jgi:hypothetical protein
MAIKGAHVTFAATPTSLTSVLLGGRPGPSLAVRQLDVQASPANNDNMFIGGSDVSSTAAWAVLVPGKAWGTEEDLHTVGDAAYLHGTEGESAHVIWVE